jgi:uncharacterized membrane protein
MPELSGNVFHKNITAIAEMEHAALHQRSALDRLSDGINKAAGSLAFALIHCAWFGWWLLVNTGTWTSTPVFDPFPFDMLGLLVSVEAVFLSVFVLMSQNRMTRQADKRAHLDLQVNLLAEQELTAILVMVQGLCKQQGVNVVLPKERFEQLTKETDVHKLADALEERLPG